MRELVISICDKVCCSADCHCKRYDDGDEFTCESCFIQEAIASAITSAVEAERERVKNAAKFLFDNGYIDKKNYTLEDVEEAVAAIRQTPTQGER